jgi:dolichyl-phosphate-mannose--protein O-mannosyl transferase
MGNPAVWWLSVPALIFCLWRMLLGSPRWRAGVPVLMLVSLLGLIVLFRAAQAPDAVSVRVSPSPLFYLCFAGMICAAVATALAAVLSRRFVPAFILLAYITAWMMWVPGNERRVLFFYHALGMLPFAALALAYVLSAMRGAFLRVRSREISLAPLSYAVVATVVASFVFFYPVWTGAPLPFADHEMRIWTDTW